MHPLSAIDTLLPSCDWLVLACSLTPETRGLMDARRLALLRLTAGLVNVARGEIVDEAALAGALAAQRLGRAYLDVFTSAPLARESPLWKLLRKTVKGFRIRDEYAIARCLVRRPHCEQIEE